MDAGPQSDQPLLHFCHLTSGVNALSRLWFLSLSLCLSYIFSICPLITAVALTHQNVKLFYSHFSISPCFSLSLSLHFNHMRKSLKALMHTLLFGWQILNVCFITWYPLKVGEDKKHKCNNERDILWDLEPLKLSCNDEIVS